MEGKDWEIFLSGDEGDRTPDLLNAIQTLSQLSYAPGHGKRKVTPFGRFINRTLLPDVNIFSLQAITDTPLLPPDPHHVDAIRSGNLKEISSIGIASLLPCHR